MTNVPCPPAEELLRLVDGELSENRTSLLRAHALHCERCARELETGSRLAARIAAPVHGVPSPGAAQALLRRLDAAVAPRPRARAWWWAVGAGALAAAMAVTLAVLPRPPRDAGGFRARGTAVAWRNRIGVELWALEETPRKLGAGASVAPGTAFVASYTNLDRDAAHLLAFGVDAHGEVHWLYPAFDDPRTDPQSVRLEPLHVQQALPDAVAPEALPPGPLRMISITSRQPLRVSSVEALSAGGRALDALRARFRDARVDELILRVEPAPTPANARPHP